MTLFDSDILTLFFAGHARIAERVRHHDEDVSTTIINRIELLKGRFEFVLKAADAQQLARGQDLLNSTVARLDNTSTVFFTDSSLTEFDRIRMFKALRKIGRADLLIAAIALAHDALLVTRNQRDFHHVPGLRIENWAD